MAVSTFTKVTFLVLLTIFLAAASIYLFNRVYLLLALGVDNWKCVFNLPTLDTCTNYDKDSGNCNADKNKSPCEKNAKNFDLEKAVDEMRKSNSND